MPTFTITHNNHVIRVYEQGHPQYPPYVATVTVEQQRGTGKQARTVLYMRNVEAHKFRDALDKALALANH